MSKPSRSKANIQIHWESLFWILSPVSCLLPSALPAYPAQLAKNPRVNYAKQTQLSQRQNQCNLLFSKELHQYSAPLRPKKQTQSNPIPPPRRDEIRNTRYEIRSQTAPP